MERWNSLSEQRWRLRKPNERLRSPGIQFVALKGEIDDGFPDGSEVSAVEPGDPKRTCESSDDSGRLHLEPRRKCELEERRSERVTSRPGRQTEGPPAATR